MHFQADDWLVFREQIGSDGGFGCELGHRRKTNYNRGSGGNGSVAIAGKRTGLTAMEAGAVALGTYGGCKLMAAEGEGGREDFF